MKKDEDFKYPSINPFLRRVITNKKTLITNSNRPTIILYRD